MTLTINNKNLTDRLIDGGTSVSADISDVFGMLAKAKTYTLRDYDDYLNPFAAEGIFNKENYRGQVVREIDDQGVVRFYGTIQNIEMTDTQECIVHAAEPLQIFLDWPVEATDQDTYAGYLVNGAVTTGQTVTIDTGTLSLPIGAQVSFGSSKVPSYLITAKSPASGATTSITLDRPVESPIDDNSTITVYVPDTTTGPQAMKDALTTAVPGILLDGTFDILAASDLANGYTIIINVREQDDVKLRDHITALREGCDLYLFQKNNGYYTLRRGLEWNRQNITDELTADELCPPHEPRFDDSQLIIGYDLPYKEAEGSAALLVADVDPAYVTKYKGIKYFQPWKTASTFAGIKYMYANVTSAEYFGERRLQYFSKPRTEINCTAKPAYSNDPLRPLDLYLGKQVRASIRTFSEVPAIVVGYEYDERRLQYTKVRLQLNEAPIPVQRSVDRYLTEISDYLTTEDSAFLEVQNG